MTPYQKQTETSTALLLCFLTFFLLVHLYALLILVELPTVQLIVTTTKSWHS